MPSLPCIKHYLLKCPCLLRIMISHMLQTLAWLGTHETVSLQTLTNIGIWRFDSSQTLARLDSAWDQNPETHTGIGFWRIECSQTLSHCAMPMHTTKVTFPSPFILSNFIHFSLRPKKYFKNLCISNPLPILTFLQFCRFVLKIFLLFSCIDEIHAHIFASSNNNKTTF